ncbi:hypothetical protein Tco_0846959, partial [Tanacetum coccineum]
MDWGEVNPVHAYYNGSRTSKDNEDPGWNTSFKTRRTQKTTSAVEALWKTILRCYLYLLGTFSNLAPQRQEMFVENVFSGLVPQGQKASDYDNCDPVPLRQNVVPTAEKTDSSQQGLEFL